MRVIVVAALVLAALVRAGFDWRATAGSSNGFSLLPIGRVVSDAWPETTATFIADWQRIPILWDPIGQAVLALPLALVLGLIAATLWVARPRPGTR